MLARTDGRCDPIGRWGERSAEGRKLTAGASERGQARLLGPARDLSERSQATWMRDQLAKRRLRDGALRIRPAQPLHLRPTRFDDSAVRDAGRADRLARAAAEAQVDVLELLLFERQAAALPLRHQIDASARRLGLESGDAKSRARVEAKPAVDAGGKVVVAESLEGFQTRNRPGLSAWFGSNASFNRCMRAMVGEACPTPRTRE